MKSDPKVGIGLPVFNGETFLEEAIESLLGQTYQNIEIVIADITSCDATREICERYSLRDPRVRHVKNESNIGAAANFNRVYTLCNGEYFKWAAHDDVCGPDFVAECVNALEQAKDGVLSFPRAAYIDEKSRKTSDGNEMAPELSSPNAGIRFAAMMGGHKCLPIFGVIRRQALEKTDLMGDYSYGDGVLLARLALLGRFVSVSKELFYSRTHPGQSMALINDRYQYSLWFNPAHEGKSLLPWWRTQYEFLRATRRLPLRWEELVMCYKSFYWSIRSRRKLLIRELLDYASGRVRRRKYAGATLENLPEDA